MNYTRALSRSFLMWISLGVALAAPAERNEITVERGAKATMRDGVILRADIYRPKTDGCFPVLLERTPYDKLSPNLVLSAKYFASHGYAVVLQDVRGRYESEGEFYPFGNEGPDGVETLAWVRGQPWCDGRVATIGLSYSSCTQTSLAALDPPGLAAQFVSMGFHNYHTASMRQGGALELRFAIYSFMMAQTSHEAMTDAATRVAMQHAWGEIRSWLAQLPPKPGLTPLRHVPSYERWLLDIWQHGEYDDYWAGRPGYSIEGLYERHADVPVYLCGGWYDSYARSTVTNYVELSGRKKGPVRLIMGPWIHGGANLDLSHSGDVEFGPDAPLGYDHFRRTNAHSAECSQTSRACNIFLAAERRLLQRLAVVLALGADGAVDLCPASGLAHPGEHRSADRLAGADPGDRQQRAGYRGSVVADEPVDELELVVPELHWSPGSPVGCRASRERVRPASRWRSWRER